ncbi:hypothetical protein NGR_b03820 (plasmid) [Sinorhizobium fredii NGR234]|uniref:Uncharacterized protein n=1 Tax=Sinorhizobium fredii (strain NBRC 101917 / NGR234) TaxID=394 RepID=Q6W1Q9_SINFN|nr:Hypothetical protein RNGR00535 [Sinorhizobium fredii NGR234]ACP21846.1 hypothetical protein NGR_b03820 [Sinorhizobium fredii NGR234]
MLPQVQVDRISASMEKVGPPMKVTNVLQLTIVPAARFPLSACTVNFFREFLSQLF